jgi:hypothetical protein
MEEIEMVAMLEYIADRYPDIYDEAQTHYINNEY